MSTTQCGFDPVTSVGPVCSGNGVCGNTTLFPTRAVCTCNEGWQGESDFQVTNSLLDCQINVVAIKVLWAVCLFIHLLVFLFSHFPKSKWLWKKHQAIVQRNKAAGKTYRLWDNKGLISLVPYLTIGWWSQTIFSIIKLVDQDLKIGSSVLVTVLYLCWRTTFFFAPCSKSLGDSRYEPSSSSMASSTAQVLTISHSVSTCSTRLFTSFREESRPHYPTEQAFEQVSTALFVVIVYSPLHPNDCATRNV